MSRLIDGTPRADGFRMPGEFEPQAQIWMLWPQRPDNWRLGAEPAQRSWVQVATAISRFEPVTVGVNHDQYENAVNCCRPVRVIELSANDAWMRDCGPTFVVDDKGGVRSSTGASTPGAACTTACTSPGTRTTVPQKVAQIEGVDRYRAPIVLEGGAIHTDGQGTLLTTEECLLARAATPSSRRRRSRRTCATTWRGEGGLAGRGMDPEETNGHVDGVACFVRPAWCWPP